MSFLENKIHFPLTILLALACGAGSLVFLPAITKNVLFVIAIPFVCILFLLAVMNKKATLILLLFTRGLLDPVLETTGLNLLGLDISAGAMINLFIIILPLLFIFKNPHRMRKNSFFRSWILFLAICFVTVMYSPVLSSAIKLYLNLLSYFSMCIIPFYVVKNEQDKIFWIKMLFFSTFAPVLFANIDLLMGGTDYFDAAGRVKGTFSHPNILAFYLGLVIAISFYILKSNVVKLNRFQKNLLLLYMLNLAILLISTKTRSAWISCWFFIFVYGMIKERKYLLVALLLPPLMLLHPATKQRVQDLMEDRDTRRGEHINSLEWRLDLWQKSLDVAKKRPLRGYGLSSFKEMSFSIYEEAFESHNVYLQLFYETGVLGLLSFLLIYFTILKRFFSRFKRKSRTPVSTEYAIIFSYLISYMLSCFSDNMLFYLTFNWYFWFFICVILRSVQIQDEKKLSVIIPSFNSIRTVEYALKVLKAQIEGGLIEEVIVADSSNDRETRPLLSQYESEKIRILPIGERVMPAITRNRGAKEARGDILAFIDSDAFPAPDWVEKIAESYERGCKVGGGGIEIPDFQKNNLVALAQYYLQFNEYISWGANRIKNFVPSCNLFCEKELFQQSGGFPEVRASEDTLFGLKVSQMTPLWFLADAKVYHVFRTKWKEFLNNQVLLGQYVSIYRKKYYDSFIYKGAMPLLLFPVFMCIKLPRMIFRILRAGKPHTYRFMISLPVFLIGFLFWSIGFIKGCLSTDENS